MPSGPRPTATALLLGSILSALVAGGAEPAAGPGVLRGMRVDSNPPAAIAAALRDDARQFHASDRSVFENISSRSSLRSTHLLFQQRIDGLRVIGGGAAVAVDRSAVVRS